MTLPNGGVVVYRHAGTASAIDEYSRHLVGALTAAGAATCYEDAGLGALLAGPTIPSWVLLQYNPFSYGRWGFAPGLIRDAMRVRMRWPRAPFVVTVHEAWVPIADWRSALMSAYQRAQIMALLALASRVIVVRGRLARELRCDCTHIPVGSNVTPTKSTARAARSCLGMGARFVVALFGTRHPSRALRYAEDAIAALAARRGADAIYVLNLGRDTPGVALPQGVAVRTPGDLSNDMLSLHLRASDLLLLPFDDGLSTRRTTLMAGLAHSVAVAGLRGFNTDRVLIDNSDAMLLTEYGDPAAYARGVVALTDDPVRLAAMASAGRRLYERAFDWPAVARATLAAMPVGRETA